MQTIIDTLKAIREGELLQEIEVQMRDLVDAVRTTNKGGKLVITLKLTPSRGGALILDDEYKLTRPEPPRETSTVFFATEANDLSRRDPRQPSLLDRPRAVVPMAQAPAGERNVESNG